MRLASCRISAISELLRVPRELEFEACPEITTIDEIAALRELRFLGLNDCGDIETLAPITALEKLEVMHAWGTTRILDHDLSPLTHLPRLREIRMRDRRAYVPQVAELAAAFPDAAAESAS